MKKQKTLFSDILETVTKYFLVLVVVVLIGIFFSGMRRVESGNVAVVLRFGKLVGDTPAEQVHEPGLLFAFPYIIDEVVMVPVGSVMEQSVVTHYTDPAEISSTAEGGYLVTGDRNIATVSASVKYVISDPVAYALSVKNVEGMINGAVSNALQAEAARVDVDELLTSGKDAFAASVLARASEKLALLGTGVTITTVELTRVGMPEEVREQYEAVNAAMVEAKTMEERAAQYAAQLTSAATIKKNNTISAARSEYSTKVAEANTDLAEFWGIYEEIMARPEAEREAVLDYVRARVYSDKVLQVMQTIGKVFVVEDGDSKIFIDP